MHLPIDANEIPLLRTKLMVPPLGRATQRVPRPHLIERLTEGLDCRLTLVSAPAGFGKTTLVSEWAYALGAGGHSFGEEHLASDTSPPMAVAWLSLDEGDSDLHRFWDYVIAALQTLRQDGDPVDEEAIGQGASTALHAPQAPPTEAILIALINDLAARSAPALLILDDYHVIETQAVHDAIAFFLEHLPPRFHLAITTRDDPPLPLARWRARGQLNELRAKELRFTSAQAAQFLNQVMGLNLSADEVAVLETRTEGWIAGLQLAAISMQGRGDVADAIRAFTGSHRFVLDYLVEEVLEQQPVGMQEFLLRTAILNRMTGPLCDAVRFGVSEVAHPPREGGREPEMTGQVMLQQLEQANLFVVPLDQERRWYRYHHLFADLLRQRLSASRPALTKELHARACAWYERDGDTEQALYHALAMGDVETATRLVEDGAAAALGRSDLGFILRSVKRLPDGALAHSPWLAVYHCWALVLTGQQEAARRCLDNTGWLLAAVHESDPAREQEMRGFVAGLRAINAIWKRDLESGLEHARQAMALLPKGNWIRGYCAIVIGARHWSEGDLVGARETFALARDVGLAANNRLLAVSAVCNLGRALEQGGELGRAIRLYRDSFRLAEQDGHELPVAGYIHIDLARALYETNDLDAARHHLERGIARCRQSADGRAEMIGHSLMVRVRLAQGQFDAAWESVRQASAANPAPHLRFDMRGGEHGEVWLWIREERRAQLKAWLEQARADLARYPYPRARLNSTMQARCLIALGRTSPEGDYLQEAQGFLAELAETASRLAWRGKETEVLALQALAFDAVGQVDEAMVAIERALAIGEPRGYLRTFLDEGAPMARLLHHAVARGIAPDGAGRLLAAFPILEPESPLPMRASETELIEPLSEREIEVLELLAQGLTNQQAASRLYLTLNTVKAHTRNIYGKLAVHSRTQAVARARSLGLLASD